MKGAAGAAPCYAQHTPVQLFLRFLPAPIHRPRASGVHSSARGGRVRQLPGGRMMSLTTKPNDLSCCKYFFELLAILIFLTLSQPALRHLDRSPSNFRYRQLSKFTRFSLQQPHDHPSVCIDGGPGAASGGLDILLQDTEAWQPSAGRPDAPAAFLCLLASRLPYLSYFWRLCVATGWQGEGGAPSRTSLLNTTQRLDDLHRPHA